MIAKLAAMLRDERGTGSESRAGSLQFNGGSFLNEGVPWIESGPTLYPSLLHALKDGYQVYNQAPGAYFLRQRFPGGWKFAHVMSRDKIGHSLPKPASMS